MLFFLTGDIQTGKTRWLQKLVGDLSARNVTTYGVIAPGTWIEHENAANTRDRYEKTGIDNLLLPEGRLVPFARRRDLAQNAGTYRASSQAGRANLAWSIDDHALEVVNDHLVGIRLRTDELSHREPGFLVIDELGQLELKRDGGLTAAVALIDRGATGALPHALVVVRRQLLETAQTRFEGAPWNGLQSIHPDEAGRASVLDALGCAIASGSD